MNIDQRSKVPAGRRRAGRMLAVGLALSVSPLFLVQAHASASSPMVTVTGLSVGARGDAVRALQNALVASGIPLPGGVDGIYGNATANAVSAFQSAKGLKATGSVDEATAAALGLATPGTSALAGLAQGANGEKVRQLQQALVNAGIQVHGGVDGLFGPGTKAAVVAFQAARGLQQTGVVDEATSGQLAGFASAGGGVAANPMLGLRIGTNGDAVRQLQQALLDAGIEVKGGVDGIFGVATVNALSQFQYAKGLKVTAKVDDATAAALGQPKPVAVAPSQPAAPAATAAMVGLAPGAVGDAVKSLQQALINLGITVRGGADGIYGPVTSNAVKVFQTSQGIEASGRVDEPTAAALAAPKPVGAPPANPSAALGFAVYGERGERVKQLQQALVNAGVNVRGGVDGIFGSATAGAIIEFQRARALNATGVVDNATGQALGLTPREAPTTGPAPTVALQAFPVQGRCFYGDSWLASRGGGRLHEGVDIGAAEGKYVYAVADGVITKRYVEGVGTLTGNGLRLSTSDGTYFFYAHLQGVAPGIAEGTPVKAGQIIGYLGKSGNAGVPHLHFEVHPRGGAAVNPYTLIKPIDGCSVTEPPSQPG